MSLIEELINLEDQADKINGNRGDKEKYCIYCKSTEYNGAKGIIHSDICVITQLRNLIKEETSCILQNFEDEISKFMNDYKKLNKNGRV